MRLLLIGLFISNLCLAQTNSYDISFENAVHHEAKIKANFPQLKANSLILEMSSSSPGRYAIHQFAKNIYDLKATNSKGDALVAERVSPSTWKIKGHDGEVNLEYLLFANRADGTYSQVDETHAHLNIPATFIYPKNLEHREVEVHVNIPKESNWKIATQLKKLQEDTFYAPNLYYFMDSPIEVSDFEMKEFNMDGKTIRFALHQKENTAQFETYFEQVKKIVEQEKMVFGELPAFDFDTYTFLACYLPHVSGDGMEHRNSTILTDTESIEEGGMKNNIGTVSHEFFHAWNVERIRPHDLEPFDFTKANMSGGLWFAEGFTSYYTNLILTRAGIISNEDYVNGLNGTFNYVWNSPALKFFNPIEMSYQAPFVDAATSLDPVNRENTFISYYSYGSVLGLALDLSLRKKDLNLDDFMKQVWQQHGKKEVTYTIEDLQNILSDYAGKEFAVNFFERYIYHSEMPNYMELFENVGLKIKQNKNEVEFGAAIKNAKEHIVISGNPHRGKPAYNALLEAGDIITSVDGILIKDKTQWGQLLENYAPGKSIEVKYMRNNKEAKTQLHLSANTTYTICINKEASKKAIKAREKWLQKR
ncbi:PDZ domain-containing protein [Gillisia sp. M10.2A]|uniref:PDZ domain-containing protein n=1 Tax=Gillisia lutea TaxID=2909668 RepID=A0ABS9EC98_9FLAO|nr:PDZ domain-containing protein [Gillisia lutea]MCF4100472.1 PDZ domain-containing protein [Gillisia lutea]